MYLKAFPADNLHFLGYFSFKWLRCIFIKNYEIVKEMAAMEISQKANGKQIYLIFCLQQSEI